MSYAVIFLREFMKQFRHLPKGMKLRVLREFKDKEFDDAVVAVLEEDKELLKKLARV